MSAFDFVRPSTQALWTFDNEHGMDSGPNGNDLVVGIPSYALGRFGKGIRLNGSNYLRCNSVSPSLRLTTLSICFWINTTNSGDEGILFSFIDDTEWVAWGYALGNYYNNVYFLVGDGSAWLHEHYGHIYVADGKWHWIVITRDASKTRIYVDGILDLNEDSSPIGYNNSEVANIGALYSPSYGDYRFNYIGASDQFQILDTKLSYAIIRQMYAVQMGWL